MQKPDWADKLCAAKLERGVVCSPQSIRDKIEQLTVSNVQRNNPDVTDPTEITILEKKERKRQIKLFKSEELCRRLEHQFERQGVRAEFYGSPPRVMSVQVNFTRDEWDDLFMRRGDHLPNCCSDATVIRNILKRVWQDEDKMCGPDDLLALVELVQIHGFPENNPLHRLKLLWDAVKKYTDEPEVATSDPTDVDGALSILSDTAGNFIFRNMFGDRHGETRLIEHANNEKDLFTLMTCLHTLNTKLATLSQGEITGFTVVQNGKIVKGRNGLIFFSQRSEADKFCEQRKKYTVQAVKVSMQKGVEFV